MKFGLTFVVAAILLSACTDSKENTLPESTPLTTTTRSIAKDYQVIKLQAQETVACWFDLANREAGKFALVSQQHVSLATANATTIMKDGTIWLPVITDDQPSQPCYVETSYLEPAPVY